jgi:NAD(P)-dependent dehydrogenase (short-subunit alcohol dehydrogenase family)
MRRSGLFHIIMHSLHLFTNCIIISNEVQLRQVCKVGIWTSRDIERQDGRRVFVTGGLSGIGFQAALAMGEKGADVTVIGRDAARGQQALAELRRIVPGASFSFEQADLADLKSISELTDRVLPKGQQIDLLLNVAGVMAVPERRLTVDGFEMHMGTNHIGHFALTGRLLPLLRKGRVVQVTALVARWAKLDLSDLQSSNSYNPMTAYAKSKLANILFAVELNKRFGGFGPSAVAVDPGTANTSLQRHTSGLVHWLGEKVIKIIGYPLDRVADPVVFGAIFPAPDDHTYVKPSKFIQKSGPPAYVEVPRPALDTDLGKRLWELSEELTGVHYREANQT